MVLIRSFAMFFFVFRSGPAVLPEEVHRQPSYQARYVFETWPRRNGELGSGDRQLDVGPRSQRGPPWENPLYKPYITWIFMGKLSPRIPRLNTINTMGTLSLDWSSLVVKEKQHSTTTANWRISKFPIQDAIFYLYFRWVLGWSFFRSLHVEKPWIPLFIRAPWVVRTIIGKSSTQSAGASEKDMGQFPGG